MTWLLLLLSCTPEEEPRFERLPARAQLIRLSVDLRGVHPNTDELDVMDESDAAYEAYVDRFLDDPRFIDRMKDIFNLRFYTRTGDTFYDPAERSLSQLDRRHLADIISEEPLALLEHILKNDLPYSTMVTADYTMANPVLAQMWNIDYPEGSTGWQPAHYRDGRPHAGILSMTTIWERYPSMGGNANRHRANALSRMLLCDDFLTRPIVLNRAAVDQLTIDPEDAIRTNASCQSCHTTLDPLASNLFGFFTYDTADGIGRTIYRQEFEENWRYYSGKEPGYFGRPTSNIVELGEQFSTDQRFIDCAVQTVFEGLTQRKKTDLDWTELSAHANTFVEEGQSIKALVRSIVLSEPYRAGTILDEATNERISTVRMVSPAQLEAIIADLTGYTWTFDGRPGLSTTDRGLGVLMGGIDSRFILNRTYVPGVGAVFTQERLAQAAGYHVAEHDLNPEREGDAKLLRFVTLDDTPEDAHDAFVGQIHALYLEITGNPLAVDATEPEHLIELWKTQHSVEADPVRAWGSVVSAILRDPAVLFY